MIKQKLILEGFEDEVVTQPMDPVENPLAVPAETPTIETELTPEEITNFNVGMVSELLNKLLDVYTEINNFALDPNLQEDLRNVIPEISEDLASIIGKLQGSFKVCAGDDGEAVEAGEAEVTETKTEQE